MELRELQSWFIQKLSRGVNSSAELEGIINTSPGAFSTSDRVKLYRALTQTALQSALERVFHRCREMLGQSEFTRFAQSYISRHPSTDPNLNYYGHLFPEFLLEHTTDKPGLSELTTLEWLINLSQLSPDDEIFSFERFAALPQDAREELVFRLSPSLFLMCTKFNLLDDSGAVPPKQALEAQYLVICRYQGRVAVTPVDPQTFAALDALQSECTLGELASYIDCSTTESSKLLPTFVEQGWVVGFYQS